MDDDGTVHFGGHVVIRDHRILAVGEGDYAGELPSSRVDAHADLAGAEVIDAAGMVVMPGLIDLHYHTAVGKGFCDHLPLRESLEEFWYPSIRALDAESAYWAAAASYLESVKSGVTTVNDMYRRLPDLARAAVDIGIRAVLSNDVALDEHNLDTLQDNKDAYDAVHGLADGRIQVRIGIEWLPLASPALLAEARALADELGTGIHIPIGRLRRGARPGRRPDTGAGRDRVAAAGLARPAGGGPGAG